MDAAEWAPRQWLRRGHLAADCGHDTTLPRERYAASLPGMHGNDDWRLIIDMGSSTARVTATQDASLRLAPEAPLQVQAAPRGPAPVRESIVRPRLFPRDQLDSVRRAWRSPQLWSVPVSDSPDDPRPPPIVLEACVDGRYVVRLRHAPASAQKLAAALDALLGPPPAAR